MVSKPSLVINQQFELRSKIWKKEVFSQKRNPKWHQQEKNISIVSYDTYNFYIILGHCFILFCKLWWLNQLRWAIIIAEVYFGCRINLYISYQKKNQLVYYVAWFFTLSFQWVFASVLHSCFASFSLCWF